MITFIISLTINFNYLIFRKALLISYRQTYARFTDFEIKALLCIIQTVQNARKCEILSPFIYFEHFWSDISNAI